MRSGVPPDELVVDLGSVDRGDVALVGGKAANLGELTRVGGIDVPVGCCVTTTAYRRALASSAPGTAPGDVPGEVAAAIRAALTRLDPEDTAAFAVRSSATAEDGGTTSFAGLHDSFLSVVGHDAVLAHVVRCWRSLHTERAVAYRERHGLTDGAVAMAVIVQRMVDASASGVLFTADPVTGHRRTTAIEVAPGLGDVLVGGHVTPDVLRVRDDRVIERTVAAPHETPVLTDAQAIRLAEVGRVIQAHFGRPQDVEWCLAGDQIRVVQSRPITTLFPVPGPDDGEPHVFVSVGHQQMMTDPMRPLGLTLWQRVAMIPMYEAAGRLFVDVAQRLAIPAVRDGMLEVFRRSDPLVTDALRTVIERGDLLPAPPAPGGAPAPGQAPAGPPPPTAPIATDPAIVAGLVRQNEESVAALERTIAGTTGEAALDVIVADLPHLQRRLANPESHEAIMAGMEATWWLNDHLAEWLGETDAADALAQSAPGNITSEMGLALLDVADAVRPHPEVVAFLRGVGDDDTFLDRLPEFEGGGSARAAILAYLDVYGVRCVGEIDITRPRWSERPSTLVPVILADIDHFESGEARRRFVRGVERATAREHDVLRRLRALPDGEAKAEETKRMIDRLRTFIGYREYPKYGIVRRMAVWKRALTAEADRLVAEGVLRHRDDVSYLRLDELRDVVRTREPVDDALVDRRKQEHEMYRAFTPPRVITSDGEVFTGSYHREGAPAGALVGFAVSAGTVEGRARVVDDMSVAELEPGDILVTAFTDPSWSPLFVAAAGLVTEVGGAMTHGAVIAREYGLPAVTGVERATQRIRDGQRIRVHGSAGWVELLEG